MAFVTRLRGEHVSTVEGENDSFDSGIPESGRKRAEALYALIDSQQFQKGDRILITTNIDGVLASAVVTFSSVTKSTLYVKTNTKRLLALNLKNSRRQIGFQIEHVCLYRAHDKKDNVEDLIRYVSWRYGGVRDAEEEDEKQDESRIPRPAYIPLNPISFLLGDARRGGPVEDTVAYEKGTPMRFTMARVAFMAKKPVVETFDIRGTLVQMNKDGILLENVDESLWDMGEIQDTASGLCLFRWIRGNEFGAYMITSDETTIGSTYGMFTKDVPEEKLADVKKRSVRFKNKLG